jgi:hypothetical protein
MALHIQFEQSDYLFGDDFTKIFLALDIHLPVSPLTGQADVALETPCMHNSKASQIVGPHAE